eukprot:1668651-Amphidinium_carterae.1
MAPSSPTLLARDLVFSLLKLRRLRVLLRLLTLRRRMSLQLGWLTRGLTVMTSNLGTCLVCRSPGRMQHRRVLLGTHRWKLLSVSLLGLSVMQWCATCACTLSTGCAVTTCKGLLVA